MTKGKKMPKFNFTAEQIAEQRAKVAALDTAITEIVTSGQSYSLQGSHSLTRADLSKVQAQYAAESKKLLLMLRGKTSARDMEVPLYV